MTERRGGREGSEQLMPFGRGDVVSSGLRYDLSVAAQPGSSCGSLVSSFLCNVTCTNYLFFKNLNSCFRTKKKSNAIIETKTGQRGGGGGGQLMPLRRGIAASSQLRHDPSVAGNLRSSCCSFV